jgi:NAD(P)-dependent dehydrogenase (short-subunit alcohol dehydrogenase family)
MLTFDFRDKTAVVTGAGGGMGEAIATAILEAGGKVLMLDVKQEPEGYARFGERALYVQGDIRDEAHVNGAVERALSWFGGIDYLANVAGVLWFGRDKSALEMDLGIWDEVFAINLKAMVHMVRAVVPHMKARGGGAMVHFSSVQCLRGDPIPQDAYSASKAGVGALSRSLAMQLAAHNIRSNAIYPGPTHSPMQARWDTEEKVAAVGSHIPLGRVGRPEDLANATLFLLSDGASYITGIDLIVDGGLLLK